MRRSAVVLGGTGMLASCTSALVGQGWQVVVPSRHPAFIAGDAAQDADDPPGLGAAARASLRPPGHLPTSVPSRQAHWVQGDWAEPDLLAANVDLVLVAPAELLVAWVRSPHRTAVLHAVAPLLALTAPVVEVHDFASWPVTPELADHLTHQVVLGRGESGRWLTHAEVSDGVLGAVLAGLAGEPPRVHFIGC